MKKFWIISLALMLTACANLSNRSKFVATPVPDDIRKIVYSTATTSGIRTWRLSNDDLRIRQTTKLNNGSVVSDSTRIMKPNDFNWVVYSLKKANFTQAKSQLANRATPINETLSVITQDGTHSFTQNKTTTFPNEFQAIVKVIPALSNTQNR